MVKLLYPYKYKIKIGNKIIFKGMDKRMVNYLIAKNPKAKVCW